MLHCPSDNRFIKSRRYQELCAGVYSFLGHLNGKNGACTRADIQATFAQFPDCICSGCGTEGNLNYFYTGCQKRLSQFYRIITVINRNNRNDCAAIHLFQYFIIHNRLPDCVPVYILDVTMFSHKIPFNSHQDCNRFLIYQKKLCFYFLSLLLLIFSSVLIPSAQNLYLPRLSSLHRKVLQSSQGFVLHTSVRSHIHGSLHS